VRETPPDDTTTPEASPMLVLTCTVDEEIVITDDRDRQILVTIVDLRDGHVRVGIEAPQGFEIARSELGE
jgi:carbon storage regulator CsrA